MSASYAFDVDPARSLMRVTLTGFFTVDDVAAFVMARVEAHRRLDCAPNQHITLVDVRGMNIQSQACVAEFRTLLADPHAAGRRIAFVVAQSLARLQAQRAAGGRSAAYFTTLAEAEQWLLTEDASATFGAAPCGPDAVSRSPAIRPAMPAHAGSPA